MYGLPQIDYIVRSDIMNVAEIQELIMSFKKTRLWKEKEWDQIVDLENEDDSP